MLFHRRFATCLCLALFFLAFSGNFSIARAEDSAFRALPEPLPLPALIIEKPNAPQAAFRDVVRQRLAGKKGLFLVLWSPSCPVCREEMQRLDAHARKLEEDGYSILALAEDPNGSVTVPAFARRYQIKNIDFFYDPALRAASLLGVRGVPTSYLIDRNEMIVSRHYGALDWQNITPDNLTPSSSLLRSLSR